MKSKLKRWPELKAALRRIRSLRKQIAFTNGCFDILHAGHIRYLKKAASLGDCLVIGLNSDSSVRAIKGNRRPINCQTDRAEVLSSLYFVDYIIIFNERTPEKLIEKVMPDILVKGGDWKMQDIVGANFVKSYGGRVVIVPFVKGYSTTSVIEKASRTKDACKRR